MVHGKSTGDLVLTDHSVRRLSSFGNVELVPTCKPGRQRPSAAEPEMRSVLRPTSSGRRVRLRLYGEPAHDTHQLGMRGAVRITELVDRVSVGQLA